MAEDWVPMWCMDRESWNWEYVVMSILRRSDLNVACSVGVSQIGRKMALSSRGNHRRANPNAAVGCLVRLSELLVRMRIWIPIVD